MIVIVSTTPILQKYLERLKNFFHSNGKDSSVISYILISKGNMEAGPLVSSFSFISIEQ
jgi:hypothetical protein